MFERLTGWAGRLKAQLLALWFCRAHPGTPLAAKLAAVLVLAYAFSPIDLIPDFIPVLGYLDDLLLVPLGIYLTLRMIPGHVVAASREKAALWLAENKRNPRSHLAAALILVIWAALAYWTWTVVVE